MPDDITTEEREVAEAEGKTAYGTSYPMRTCAEVEDAITAYGRAPENRRELLRRKIAQRNIELGCDIELPEDWHLEAP